MQTPKSLSLFAQIPRRLIETAFAEIGVLVLLICTIVGLANSWPENESSGRVADSDAAAVAAILAAQTVVAALPIVVAPIIPNLRASIITHSGRYEASESIALDGGSTFALSLVSNINGHIQAYAVAPDGHISRIWSGSLMARREHFTPAMRMQGMRGVETLQIVFVPTEGGEEQSGLNVVRTVSIVHI